MEALTTERVLTFQLVGMFAALALSESYDDYCYSLRIQRIYTWVADNRDIARHVLCTAGTPAFLRRTRQHRSA